jgi:hypothetical protein
VAEVIAPAVAAAVAAGSFILKTEWQ